jgi:hypothetical protein
MCVCVCGGALYALALHSLQHPHRALHINKEESAETRTPISTAKNQNPLTEEEETTKKKVRKTQKRPALPQATFSSRSALLFLVITVVFCTVQLLQRVEMIARRIQ